MGGPPVRCDAVDFRASNRTRGPRVPTFPPSLAATVGRRPPGRRRRDPEVASPISASAKRSTRRDVPWDARFGDRSEPGRPQGTPLHFTFRVRRWNALSPTRCSLRPRFDVFSPAASPSALRSTRSTSERSGRAARPSVATRSTFEHRTGPAGRASLPFHLPLLPPWDGDLSVAVNATRRSRPQYQHLPSARHVGASLGTPVSAIDPNPGVHEERPYITAPGRRRPARVR